jgi:restriction endonuclease
MSVTKNKSMFQRLPLTEARNNLGKVVRRAHMNNETFILEKDGIPIAALMNIDDFEDYLDTKDPKLNKQIKQSYREYLNGKARPVEEFMAELKGEFAKSKRK